MAVARALRSALAKFHWREIALITCGILVSSYMFYPGCMSGDALFSWVEALQEQKPSYNDWHPPFVAYTWRLLNALPFIFHPHYADLFLSMNLLYWVGLVLAIRPWIHKPLLWFIFFLCLGFFPPAFAIVSQTLKDSLMCAALLAAYGGLLAAQRQHSRMGLIGAMICMFLAMAYRHNALLAVFPLALWAGHILCKNPASWSKK